MDATPPLNTRLHSMLQAVVQSVGWTYSLFWQSCPRQGLLIWGDGYYNGAINTRKTVQPMEVSVEETSLQRSQQLRELYDFLSAGESAQQTPRPCAALSPKDLTESEWFYLMCVSFSFPPGVGLPGKAYATNQHVWLTGANKADSKFFSRAILAKSACVQTVVCIPLLDGVVELGSIEKVKENNGFIQQVKSFFMDHHHHLLLPAKPALSEHSTSNPVPPSMYAPLDPAPQNPGQINEDEEHDDDEEEEEDDEQELQSESEADTVGRNTGPLDPLVATHTEPSELMQLEMSEDLRLGLPDDRSNNLDSDFQFQVRDAESSRRWSGIENTLCNSLEPPHSDDTHYSETVSSILNHLSTRCSESSPTISGNLIFSLHSSFSKWTPLFPSDHHVPTPSADTSGQWFLKYILLTVPVLHTKRNIIDGPTADVLTSRMFRKGDEMSTGHVLAERRRREKLNERFVTLRTLVPFVTKMDKASILGDTIEYVNHLHKRIQDLEDKKATTQSEPSARIRSRVTALVRDQRKMRIVEGRGGRVRSKAVGGPSPEASPSVSALSLPPPLMPTEGVTMQVQVSIIESDVLVEMQCPHRERLLLDVMVVLRELKIEVTVMQTSLTNGVFVAEMRAKVKENVNGKKPSIVEVKRAINQIISQYV